jgi:hypothetical protein
MMVIYKVEPQISLIDFVVIKHSKITLRFTYDCLQPIPVYTMYYYSNESSHGILYPVSQIELDVVPSRTCQTQKIQTQTIEKQTYYPLSI